MKKTKWLMMFCTLVLMALPMVSRAETQWVVTPNHRSANLRSGPSMDYPVLAQIPYRTPVDVIYDIVGSSYAHCIANGQEGYIAWDLLADYEPEQPLPTPKKTATPPAEGAASPSFKGFKPALYEATVMPSNPSAFVNLRWTPSKNATVQDIYYQGQTLLVISENGIWSQVYDAQKHRSGFMMSSFLRYQPAPGAQDANPLAN